MKKLLEQVDFSPAGSLNLSKLFRVGGPCTAAHSTEPRLVCLCCVCQAALRPRAATLRAACQAEKVRGCGSVTDAMTLKQPSFTEPADALLLRRAGLELNLNVNKQSERLQVFNSAFFLVCDEN